MTTDQEWTQFLADHPELRGSAAEDAALWHSLAETVPRIREWLALSQVRWSGLDEPPDILERFAPGP